MNVDKRISKRRFGRFGLKFIVFLILIFSCTFASISLQMEEAKTELEVIQKLDELKTSSYLFDYEVSGSAIPKGPGIIRSLCGQHVFSRVSSIELVGFSRPREDSNGDITFYPIPSAIFKEIGNLRALRKLKLSLISSLKDLSMIGNSSIAELELKSCTNLHSLDGVSSLKHLTIIAVGLPRQQHCPASRFDDITDLAAHPKLRELDIDIAGSFATQANWNTLSTIANLTRLTLFRRPDYTDEDPQRVVRGRFQPNRNLEHLALYDIDPQLENFECFKQMPKLKSVEVRGSATLKSLRGLEKCQSLERLTIKNCPNLEDTSAIETLTNLKSVTIE